MIRQKQAYLKNVNDIIPHFVRSEYKAILFYY